MVGGGATISLMVFSIASFAPEVEVA